jgi:hypothetical protein
MSTKSLAELIQDQNERITGSTLDGGEIRIAKVNS